MIPWISNYAEGHGMRGTDKRSGSLFSSVDLDARVPKDHPLRAIREIANGALADLSADFAAMYAPLGRPSIPQKSCCAHRYYRRSTRSARSAN
jgi:hypothetical protein